MTAQSIPARVLVVDDDAMSRELLGALLEAEGYAVESAESGEAALALLGRGDTAPDLVLADVQMPGMTGAQLAGKLRRACGRSTLLLAMSGSRPPEKTVSRFDGFLLKPFKMAEIATALAAAGQRVRDEESAKREKWVVVRGPAGAALPSQELVSIHAPAPGAALKERMSSPVQDAPPAEPVTGPPVLNETIYRQLAGSMPAKQLGELYAMCVNDARARIATMHRLADARDGAQFMREAHAIKGGCGMLGATELHGMAAALEKNGLAAAAPGEQEVYSLDELTTACDRLERMLGSRVRCHKHP
jgi:CheY-like chemotaxis protein/HPt (histidine-containing phosphotransfer) domain-containing protein